MYGRYGTNEFRHNYEGKKVTVVMSEIKYDLNNVNLAPTTGSCCPYGDYGAVVTGVKKQYTVSGYAYVLLLFELKIRMAEGESVQVFYPTMVRWLKTSDGRTPKRLETVLDAFGYSHAKQFRRLIGKKVALTIAKGDDFGWNGKNHKMARAKSMQPYGATVVRKSLPRRPCYVYMEYGD